MGLMTGFYNRRSFIGATFTLHTRRSTEVTVFVYEMDPYAPYGGGPPYTDVKPMLNIKNAWLYGTRKLDVFMEYDCSMLDVMSIVSRLFRKEQR